MRDDELNFEVTVDFDKDMIANIMFDDQFIVKDLTKTLETRVLMVGGNGGTYDYEELDNKPSIEGVPLVGDQTFASLTMTRITNSELEDILNL